MKRMAAVMAVWGAWSPVARARARASVRPRPLRSGSRRGTPKARRPRAPRVSFASRRRCCGIFALTTAVVESRSGGEGTAVLGELHVDEDRYAEVSSAIVAQAVRLVAAPGDRLTAGQSLVELNSLDVGKARGARREAEARQSLAAQALARKRGLAEERIAPQREVQEAEAERAGRRGGFRCGERRSREPGRRRRGDRGSVRAADADRGDGAGPPRRARPGGGAGASCCSESPISGLCGWSHTPPSGTPCACSPARSPAWCCPALPGRTLTARVTLVGKQVDAASRTIPVRLQVKNDDGAAAARDVRHRVAARGGGRDAPEPACRGACNGSTRAGACSSPKARGSSRCAPWPEAATSAERWRSSPVSRRGRRWSWKEPSCSRPRAKRPRARAGIMTTEDRRR